MLLPEQAPRHKGQATLVLDLDNTLIDGEVNRPGLDTFLKAVKDKFEIVIFTAGTSDCAEHAIDRIDAEHHCIAYRLYGESCIDFLVKPAEQLGRDMKKVIVVDDKPCTYKLNPDNALPIPFFSKDLHQDGELLKLIPFLSSIAELPDVRPALRARKKEHEGHKPLRKKK